jgi:hypothetical protein
MPRPLRDNSLRSKLLKTRRPRRRERLTPRKLSRTRKRRLPRKDPKPTKNLSLAKSQRSIPRGRASKKKIKTQSRNPSEPHPSLPNQKQPSLQPRPLQRMQKVALLPRIKR